MLIHINISKGSDDNARLFLVMPKTRMRSNSHKLNHKKFHLNMRKNFPWRGAEPMESWESSFLETPGHSPVSPALGDPAWTRGVGLDDLQVPSNADHPGIVSLSQVQPWCPESSWQTLATRPSRAP